MIKSVDVASVSSIDVIQKRGKGVLAMTIYRFSALIVSLALVGTAFAAEPQAPNATSSDDGQIVARHTFDIKSQCGGVSDGMASGPLLGNGDLAVMQGSSGPAGEIIFYIGKSDFWFGASRIGDMPPPGNKGHSSPRAVGQLWLAVPQLKDSSYKTTTDMQHAEVRGEYIKGDASLTSRSWIDANRNLFYIELVNKGSVPLSMRLKNIKGTGGEGCMMPEGLEDDKRPARLGEGFNGEMADATVNNRVLSDAEIVALAQAARKEEKRYDGKGFQELSVPEVSKAFTLAAWVKVRSNGDFIRKNGAKGRCYQLWVDNFHLQLSLPFCKVYVHDSKKNLSLPRNGWAHVAVTYDGKKIAVFRDGKLQKSVVAPDDASSAFLYDCDAGNDFLYAADPTAKHPESRKVGVVTRVVGGPDGRDITLEPGKSVVVTTAVLSDLDVKGKDPLTEAKALAASLTPVGIEKFNVDHRQWWSRFWSKSSIEIPDKVIEQHWYSALYIMASCSRAGKVAPGLYGNWITTDRPAWLGDYHLNYNFQGAFYGLYSANHTETTLPFYDAMNQSIERGRSIAAKRGWKGIHLPVSFGPWGLFPCGEDIDHGQRSNAAYSALLYIWYWQHTLDKEWLKESGYTFVRETALFWEDYLKFENGRYVIYKDAMHEGSGEDMNCLLSLGLVRTLFKGIIPMSEVLGIDADKRAKWADIVAKISDYPTMEKNGKTVFRYTEKGMEWCNGNTLGIQHIYPAGAIGLDSDPKLLEVSRNMIEAMGRWHDSNGYCSWYAACARIGYDPEKVLLELRKSFNSSMRNKLIGAYGGGIENVSPALAVNEMLLQGEEQRSVGGGQQFVLRLFPCWPKGMPARFTNLRTIGAFLVSAIKKEEAPEVVHLVSEKGSPCTLVNPWPGEGVILYRNGKKAEKLSGESFTFKTTIGETIDVAAEGVEVKNVFLPDSASITAMIGTVQLEPSCTQPLAAGLAVTLQAGAGAKIFYTLDGSRPTQSSLSYTKPIAVDNAGTLRVMAVEPDRSASVGRYHFRLPDSAASQVVINGQPQVEPDVWLLPRGETSVVLQAGPQAKIFYTLDDSVPTKNSSRYTKPLALAKGCILRVMAEEPDHVASFVRYVLRNAEDGLQLVNRFDVATDLGRLVISHSNPNEQPLWIEKSGLNNRRPVPGKSGILALHPESAEVPVEILRGVQVPAAEKKPLLHIVTCADSNGGGSFYVMQVGVSADGQPMEWFKAERIVAKADGWKTIDYDLTKYGGKVVSIKIKCGSEKSWNNNRAYFDEISVKGL